MIMEPVYEVMACTDTFIDLGLSYTSWPADFTVTVSPNGSKRYRNLRALHRLHGPALIDGYGGRHGWYVNDIRYSNNDSFQRASGISDEEMLVMILKHGNVK